MVFLSSIEFPKATRIHWEKEFAGQDYKREDASLDLFLQDLLILEAANEIFEEVFF